MATSETWFVNDPRTRVVIVDTFMEWLIRGCEGLAVATNDIDTRLHYLEVAERNQRVMMARAIKIEARRAKHGKP